jgi:hypothetical protein
MAALRAGPAWTTGGTRITVQDETGRLEQSPPRPPESPPPTNQAAAAPVGTGAVAPGRPAPTAAGSGPSPAPTNELPSPRGIENLRVEREPSIPVARATLEYGAAHDQADPIYLPLALTVGAGFKFGCGLMLAVATSALALFLVLSVIFFIASLAGIPLPIGAGP